MRPPPRGDRAVASRRMISAALPGRGLLTPRAPSANVRSIGMEGRAMSLTVHRPTVRPGIAAVLSILLIAALGLIGRISPAAGTTADGDVVLEGFPAAN